MIIPLPPQCANARILSCDIDSDGRTAILFNDHDQIKVCLDGRICSLKDVIESSFEFKIPDRIPWLRPYYISWLSADRAVVWPVRLTSENGIESGAIVTSVERAHPVPFGLPDVLFVGRRFLFTAYGEQRIIGEWVGPFDEDIVTVFDLNGERLFGLNELLPPNSRDINITELSVGCTSDNSLIFIGDGTLAIGIIDADARRLDWIGPPIPLTEMDAVHVCAITKTVSAVVVVIRSDNDFTMRSISSDGGSSTERNVTAWIRKTFPEASLDDIEVRGLADGSFLFWSKTQIAKLDPG